MDEADEVPSPPGEDAAAVPPLFEWATARGAYVARALAILAGSETRPRGLVVTEAVEAGQVG